MPKKTTHTQKLLEAILETHPGISIEDAWRIYHQKYELDKELDPANAERLSKPIVNLRNINPVDV